MNCAEAKTILISQWLESVGYAPVRVASNGLWYRSPWSLQGDKTASLQVSTDGYMFHDWSSGRAGNIIDLVMAFLGTSSVSQAVAYLGEHMKINALLPEEVKRPIHRMTSRVEIVDTCALKSKALIQYVVKRSIPVTIATRYCREVRYRLISQARIEPYFAIGFVNDSGGYEIRNQYVKIATTPKDISTIGNSSHERALVFEGFIDYLSAVTLGLYDMNTSFCVVLNSTALVHRAIPILSHVPLVECYLDNDEAGRQATRTILTNVSSHVIDKSLLYQCHKDLNDYLVSVIRR